MMGKEKQEKRARKSRRKVLCIACDKSMNWEFFRNSHIHKRHGGKSIPIRVIAENQLNQDNVKSVNNGSGETGGDPAKPNASDVRSFFKPRRTKVCNADML